MDIYFKRFLSLFVFIGLSFGALKPINDAARYTYLATSVAKLPAGLAVLYAHAQSNEELEVKLKLIEALVQVANEASYNIAYSERDEYLDKAWLGFETFRVIKYLRKYLEIQKQNKKEDFESDFEDVQKDDNQFLDNNDSDEARQFKIKIVFCLISLVVESISSLKASISYDSGGYISSSIWRDSSLFFKGLRYFILSDSGSWEAKISIVLSLLSLLDGLIVINDEIQRGIVAERQKKQARQERKEDLIRQRKNLDKKMKEVRKQEIEKKKKAGRPIFECSPPFSDLSWKYTALTMMTEEALEEKKESLSEETNEEVLELKEQAIQLEKEIGLILQQEKAEKEKQWKASIEAEGARRRRNDMMLRSIYNRI